MQEVNYHILDEHWWDFCITNNYKREMILGSQLLSLFYGWRVYSNPEQRNYERAIIFFEKAIEEDDSFEAAYSALSESLNRMGKIDDAIPIVKKWIENLRLTDRAGDTRRDIGALKCVLDSLLKILPKTFNKNYVIKPRYNKA